MSLGRSSRFRRALTPKEPHGNRDCHRQDDPNIEGQPSGPALGFVLWHRWESFVFVLKTINGAVIADSGRKFRRLGRLAGFVTCSGMSNMAASLASCEWPGSLVLRQDQPLILRMGCRDQEPWMNR